MSARMGRPPDLNPKNMRTELRMTKEDNDMLEYCCKVTGKTKSDVARDGIRNIYAKLRKLENK